MTQAMMPELPGLDCGVCGCRTCAEFAARILEKPELIKRCIHLSRDILPAAPPPLASGGPAGCQAQAACADQSCGVCAGETAAAGESLSFQDSLGRDFDFYLEHFPEDPGPREIIIPHNPMITREMEISVGDILIGRPLGMSCGCPVTHCGVVREVDRRTGVMTWCVTGPLQPRELGFKDLGYYIAEGYEGLVSESRCELRIGMRYFFQPRMCMLQWRHSGLVNYLNRTAGGWQVRLEGLWIG